MEDGGNHDSPLLEDCTAAAVGSLPLLSSHPAQAAGPEAGDGPGSVTLTISAMTIMSMMLISTQARLRGPTLATCQLREVGSPRLCRRVRPPSRHQQTRTSCRAETLHHSARASSRICSRTAQRLSRFLEHMMICTPR
jgi:hypothetical protein